MILLQKVVTDIIYVLSLTTSVCKDVQTLLVSIAAEQRALFSGAARNAASGAAHRKGQQKNGSVVLPDSQVIEPAGRQITVIGRPSVIAIRPDHKTAVVINGDGNTGFSAGPIVICHLTRCQPCLRRRDSA